ncbi:MAG: vitamin K epoxide reductase family protein [Anaerolineales bacterium]|jgi:uncharacterized membrane protein
MIRGRKLSIIFLTLLLSVILVFGTVQAQEPVVHAVLFYSPTCGHCAYVIEEVLPVLDSQYGSQLLIYGVNTYTETGSALFQNYIKTFDIPAELQAVPTLVVGDQYLIGSGDIPDMFPGIIDEGLKNGGIDWPEIPGLQEAMQGQETNPDQGETTTITEPQQLTLKERFTADLAANTLSVVVLLGMIAAVVSAGISLGRSDIQSGTVLPGWLIPVISLVGLGVAGYMAFVEYTQVEAVCGPVGNCNTVQQSSYATLFGILPVGILGVLGYITILILWLLTKLNLPDYDRLIRMALWALTLFGILFSIYLTFLEPFVIGASCMWCLSSAVIMTALFLLATRELNSQTEEPGD